MSGILSLALFLSIPLSAFGVLYGITTERIAYALLLTSAVGIPLSIALADARKSLCFAGLMLLALTLQAGHPEALLFYPVAASLFAAACFISSYWSTRPLIERIARRFETQLPAVAIAHCRRVNHMWSVFLIANAGITLYLIYRANLTAWAQYTACISYVLMGVLFLLEFCMRLYIKKQHADSR